MFHWGPLGAISVTVALKRFTTQTCVPSDETLKGPWPTLIVWTTAPGDALNSVTVLLFSFVTQTCVPSDETASGPRPTPMVWTTAPVEAFNSLTVLL